MLKSRNLDDQKYADIVERAVKQIPRLCPEWTNFNPSDPGITLLELFAWYKEMQQYHLDYYTDDLKRKLLKLLGVTPEHAAPAQCVLDIPADKKRYYRGQKLSTPERVIFELAENVPENRTEIAGFYASAKAGWKDISPAIQSFAATPVFSIGSAERTQFLITFRRVEEGRLNLWFDVKDPGEPKRNPFRKGQILPRDIVWEISGLGVVKPETDETCALTKSGFLCFSLPGSMPGAVIPGVPESRYWLKATLARPGCEEEVYIKNVSGCGYRALQQESWSRTVWKNAGPEEKGPWLVEDAMAGEWPVVVLGKTARGWAACVAEVDRREGGAQIMPKGFVPVKDPERNLAFCVMDPVHAQDLQYSYSGLPEDTVRIETGGRQIIPEKLCLLADCGGKTEVWTCVEDLRMCGPLDCVFTYNETAQELKFGDGAHGRVPDAGEKAIFVCQMILTDGKDGNIPRGSRLSFAYSEETVYNTEAEGGRNVESVEEAASRFLRSLRSPQVTASAEDYRSMALKTPGLRVQEAKAVPGFDAEDPTGESHLPVVTVVVIPASEAEKPLPDKEFISSVKQYLESYRNVGTILRVAGPRYFPFELTCTLRGSAELTEEALLGELAKQFLVKPDSRFPGIGGPLRVSTVCGILEKIPGVETVRQAVLRSLGSECRIASNGDLILPPDGIPYPSRIHIKRQTGQ